MSDEPIEHPPDDLRRRVVAAVSRACPSWDKADRDDLVQTILAALVDRARGREGNRPFPSTYLEKMAYGVMVDELRRRGRRREVPLEAAISTGPASTNPGPERAAQARETAAGIRACVGRLHPDRRLAVQLYLLGCGVSEIARRAGWRAKRAENLVCRGLSEIRRCLEARGLAP